MEENTSKIKLKKSAGFAMLYYIMVTVIVSMIFAIIEFLIGLVITKNMNISTIIGNPIFIIANVTLIIFANTYIFIKSFGKRYIIDETKEAFLNKFLILIISIFTFTVTINIINGMREADTRIYATIKMDEYIENYLKEDTELFEENIKETPYETAKTEGEIKEITKNVIKNIVYDELISKIIVSTTELVTAGLFMMYFIKREEINVE